MFNPTWFYTGAVYAGAIALARRSGVEIPRRVALFFYALVLVFLYLPMTQDYVHLPVDCLKTLPPWEYTTPDPRALNGQINDLALQIIPWAHQVRESWTSLQPPLWNNFSASGYPLLANAQSSALSPLRILGLPLSLGHALTFEAAMKMLIALTFMFLWCRRRHSETASVIGATAFGFSTFIVVWLHFPLITTACFVPAVLYLTDLIVERPSYRRLIAMATVWALMLFGGHPETVSHTFFLTALYATWLLAVEKRTECRKLRVLGTLGGALVIAGLLAAPLLAPFAEAVTRSKRYQELEARPGQPEVPFSDWPGAIVLFQPDFFGHLPADPATIPTHAESISGFAGYFGVASWLALLVHILATRQWRSREAFFVLATILVLGIIMDWPGVSDVFHLAFGLAANARLRLLFVILLAIQSAAAVDLMRRDPRSVVIGILGASALLLVMFHTAGLATGLQRGTAVLAMLPSIAVLALALIAALTRADAGSERPAPVLLLLLAGITAEVWRAGYDWNPVVEQQWMYPKTPLLRALDDLSSRVPASAPFRISGDGAALFPNTSALYGYEDVRAHDPMSNARYLGLLRHIASYDAPSYFAQWKDFEKHFIDFLNVRYVIARKGSELPPRYRLVYDGHDGRIFENTSVLPRFFPVRNVILDFQDRSFYKQLAELEGWSHTALLDSLEVESRQMEDDFFRPRPADAPLASATILRAEPTRYLLHVKAPRYTLVVSSIPWWPGWKVERNGARVEPIQVNGGFLGFAVPAGELDVKVWYDPWTFRLGWIVSLATIVGLVIVGVRRGFLVPRPSP